MGLRDIEMTLPPGFRFYPSDEELVCHYLHGKVANRRLSEVFHLTWHADVGYIMHMVPCITYFIHQICHLLSLDILCANAICLVYSSFM